MYTNKSWKHLSTSTKNILTSVCGAEPIRVSTSPNPVYRDSTAVCCAAPTNLHARILFVFSRTAWKFHEQVLQAQIGRGVRTKKTPATPTYNRLVCFHKRAVSFHDHPQQNNTTRRLHPSQTAHKTARSLQHKILAHAAKKNALKIKQRDAYICTYCTRATRQNATPRPGAGR